MTATVSGIALALLAELERATSEIIERNFAADEKSSGNSRLSDYGPFEVRVYGADGYLARFLEEGVELYPEEGSAA
jgi:hypothetical protein